MAKLSAKGKGRLGWWGFGLLCGVVFGSFVPSCGDFITDSASDVAGNAAEAVGVD